MNHASSFANKDAEMRSMMSIPSSSLVLARAACLVLGVVVLGWSPTMAKDRSFCPSHSQPAEPELTDAARAAFGTLDTASSDDCVRPYKLLRYADTDVLLTSKGDGGDATCHGCGAVLSATVLARMPTAPKVLARFPDFGTFGTSGDPGRVDAMQLGGDDAIAVEESGVFQGYASTSLSLAVFHNGRLLVLKPSLPLHANDRGTAGESATSVDGAWRADRKTPVTITVNYQVRKGTLAPRDARASWVIVGDRLELIAGAIPKDYGRASGQE